MSFIYKGSVPSDLDDTKFFVENLLVQLEEKIQSEDLLFDLKIILNELIINSVIHGNRCNRNKWVDLSLTISDNSVTIQVQDEGEGIRLPSKDIFNDELSSCGRGLVIVNGLSDEVHIDNNKIVAIKHIS